MSKTSKTLKGLFVSLLALGGISYAGYENMLSNGIQKAGLQESKAGEVVVSFEERIADFFKSGQDLANKTTNALNEGAESAANIADQAKETASNTLNSVQDEAASLSQSAQENVQSGLKKVKKEGVSLQNKVQDELNQAEDSIKETANEGIQNTANAVKNAQENVETDVNKATNLLKETAQNTADQTKNTLGATDLTQASETLKALGSSTNKAIKGTAETARNLSKQAMQKIDNLNVTNAQAPSFDVVRIEPSGDATLAGRAQPDTALFLLENDQIIAQTAANASGEWVIITPRPLTKGSIQLTLKSKNVNGDEFTSKEIVAASIPENVQGELMVSVLKPGQPTQILQEGNKITAKTTITKQENFDDIQEASASQQIEAPRVAAVEIDENKLFIAGKSKPDTTIRLYINDVQQGDVRAGEAGTWLYTGKDIPEIGSHKVRADIIDPENAKVLARSQVIFNHSDLKEEQEQKQNTAISASDTQELEKKNDEKDSKIASQNSEKNKMMAGQQNTSKNIETASIEPSKDQQAQEGQQVQDSISTNNKNSVIIRKYDNLWILAERLYGDGKKYVTIYKANKDQIKDPNKIYPGQVFDLPKVN